MLKGVNRQIIEIGDTGNIYFEKALLFVRPNFSDSPQNTLSREARDLIGNASGYTGIKMRRKEQRFKKAAFASVCGVVGAAITAAIMMIVK